MARSPRRQIALGLAGLVVAGGVYWFWPGAAATAPAGSRVAGAAAKGRGAEAQTAAPDVRLEALQAPRPTPDGMKRNLFRFKPAPVPAPPAPVAVPRPAVPTAPSGPPPLPSIPLKFAGFLTQGSVKVAVLIDTMGRQIYGKEGETIEGRYKIWRIGTESIDISYIDGRGRQPIRMNGS